MKSLHQRTYNVALQIKYIYKWDNRYPGLLPTPPALLFTTLFCLCSMNTEVLVTNPKVSVFSSSIIFYTGFCKLTLLKSKASKLFVHHYWQLVDNYQESSEKIYKINIPKLFIRGTKEESIYSCICPPLFKGNPVGINSVIFHVANMWMLSTCSSHWYQKIFREGSKTSIGIVQNTISLLLHETCQNLLGPHQHSSAQSQNGAENVAHKITVMIMDHLPNDSPDCLAFHHNSSDVAHDRKSII